MPSTAKERLQTLLDEEKDKGLLDIKFFCNPDADRPMDDYYEEAVQMLEKSLRGEGVPLPENF